MEFSRQEYWSGLPCPSLWDLPDPGIKPGSPAFQADSSPTEPPEKLETCCRYCKVASVVSDSVRPHRRQAPPSLGFTRQEHWSGLPFLQSMKVKSQSEVAQSCPILRDPMDCSLPGSSVHGIFQARVLEWGAIAFSMKLTFCNVKKPR